MAIWHADTLDMSAETEMGLGAIAGRLGIRLVGYGDDRLAAEVPDDIALPFGLLHGGASVALAEIVSSVAGALTLDPDHHFDVGRS